MYGAAGKRLLTVHANARQRPVPWSGPCWRAFACLASQRRLGGGRGLLLDAGPGLGQVLARRHREVAGGDVAGLLDLERRVLLDAALLGLGAARVEAAA